jgi:hypothetical protein
MDDAFAGGVCRCQYCGTIQTVPKAKRRSGSGKSSSSSSKNGSNKALYKKGTPAGAAGSAPADSGMGTGLDDLAQVVASSGLARGSLRKPPPRARDGAADANAGAGPAAPRPAKPSLPRSVLIGGGAAVVVLLVAIIYLGTRPGDPRANTTSTGTQTVAPPVAPDPDAPPAPPPGPTFAGVPLEGAFDVAYLIDRSNANDGYLDALKVAAYRSAQSLGPKGRFQIIFWHHTDGGIVAYPEDSLALATKAELDAAKRRFEDVAAYGTTDLKPTIEKAAASGADTIVLATAKGFSLEEAHVETVVDALQGRPVKVHTISLGDAESAVLKKIAERTGGTYHELTMQELRANRR